MNNTWLVIQREYISRVKKKSFILTTLLTPLAILIFIAMSALIFSYKSDEKQRVIISDPGNLLEDTIVNSRRFEFEFSDVPIEELKQAYLETDIKGILLLPPLDSLSVTKYIAIFYSDDQLDVESNRFLKSRIGKRIREYKIIGLGLDKKSLESLTTDVEINPESVSSGQEDRSELTGIVASAIGGIMGYFMFFVIFLYGAMVMRSVSEEKISRIVELIISSVRPFDLMLGKIIGVGAVGFTQLAIWLVLIPVVTWIGTYFFGVSPSEMTDVGVGYNPTDISESTQQIAGVLSELKAMNWLLIIPLFIVYFIGGYFIFAALFAAIGSALGDEINESQSLTLPVVLPVVLAVYIMFQVIREPHSTLAVWSSIFPLFSSIIMPARLAYDPPAWQILLSLILLLATVIFMVWMAGKIYRVGILLYGKKAGFKELWKWLRYKG